MIFVIFFILLVYGSEHIPNYVRLDGGGETIRK